VSDVPLLDPYVTIILPCYNEQDHVTTEVARICAAMDASGYAYELVAFDDASTDETLARLHEAAPTFPNLRIVHFHRNGGSGTVRRIGTQQARGQIVVWTDADMTYPNERIPELVQLLEKDPSLDQFRARRSSSSSGTPTATCSRCCGW
jgi:polyisoprenyl-phosphate glycosyltransferase